MNPANALTLASAASGLVGLCCLVALPGPMAQAVAMTCVGASLVLDRLDGLVARRLGLTSAMGAQLDTLADLLAFGALPALLLVARHPTAPVVACAVAYALGAVWRLARFDTSELAVGRWGPAFRGVPSPAAAGVLLVAVAIGGVWVECAAALLMAGLMVSELRYPKGNVGAVPWMVVLPIVVSAQWWQVLARP